MAVLLIVTLSVWGTVATTPAFGAAGLWRAAPLGSAAGQSILPRGVVAQPGLPGHTYVADQENRRIDEFDAWGQFVKAWGWGVLDGTSAELQICTSASGCQRGIEGSGPGAFKGPQGLALDSDGDLYVVDKRNFRIQKFDADGNFLLMFGEGVNQGPLHPGSVCTATNITEGDICGPGTPGSEPGQFGEWPWVGSFLAVDSADVVYVGDNERVLKFGADGNFLGEVKPTLFAGKGFVQSLALDAAGNIYAAFNLDLFSSVRNVFKVSPTGAELCEIGVKNPKGITVGQDGTVYVFNQEGEGESLPPPAVEQFSSNCQSQNVQSGGHELTSATGLGTGSACLSSGSDLYVTNANESANFIRAYGPPPDNPACPPPPVPPTIDSQYATAVNDTGATVKAAINPHFWKDTSYYVEYGTGKCFEDGCAELANAPGVQLGAGIVDELITTSGVLLSGLKAGTTYHYRFVSQSAGGGPVYGVDTDGGEGPNQANFEEGGEMTFTTPPPPSAGADQCQNAAFRSGPGSRLADCRGYEMVSPVDKQNSDILALTNITELLTRLDQSANSGDRMTYSTYRAYGDAQSAPYMAQYLATRTEDGWANHSISSPREGPSFLGSGGLVAEFKAFSEDLSEAWVAHDAEPVLAPGGIPGAPNIYRRDNANDSFTAVSTAAPQNANKQQYELEMQGMSADGTHAIFRANDYLPPGAGGVVNQVYDSAAGSVSPVCVLPGEARSAAPCSAGTANGVKDLTGSVDHAISANGSRIFWTDQEVGPGRLYLRIDGKETVAVSAAVNSSAPQAQFWTAATDGSKAIFTAKPAAELSPPRLYEFDTATRAVREIAARVLGVAGASDDISRVYFVSEEALGAGSGPQPDKPNLYLYEAGQTPSFTFIATLAEFDAPSTDTSFSPVAREPLYHAARVTPDGRRLAFMSQASLTGKDNIDAQSGQADAQVFIYDSTSGELNCVSCNRTGARPTGRNIKKEVALKTPFWAAALIPAAQSQIYSSRPLSDDGSRLFFESFEPLASGDTNGKQDVYEWEALGSGTCSGEAFGFNAGAGGCVSLISSGESPEDSELIDADADGSDVFFTTAASLVVTDPGLIDVYDARIGGGFPPPPLPPVQCEGESCQRAPIVPNDPTPSSSSFSGPGNPRVPAKASKCPRGKKLVRTKGKKRCVKKGKSKKRQSNKSGRRGR